MAALALASCSTLGNSPISNSNPGCPLAELSTGAVTTPRMTAPSPDNKTDVTFGGATVAPDGRWKAKTQERIRDGNVTLPKMSAVVLRFH